MSRWLDLRVDWESVLLIAFCGAMLGAVLFLAVTTIFIHGPTLRAEDNYRDQCVYLIERRSTP